MNDRTVLFVHNNYPAQFGFIAEALAAEGVRCQALSSITGRPTASVRPNFWTLSRGSTPGISPLATRAEADFLRGQAAAETAQKLKNLGFVPDLIVGHPGWGETLFLREVFPRARQILYAEFYYHPTGVDVGFDPEFEQPSPLERMQIIAKNASMALALSQADRIVCPTFFQASLIPESFRPIVAIIHEGVDTTAISRNLEQRLVFQSGVSLDWSSPVITYVSRTLEPLRGFHVFLRSLPRVLSEVPNAHAVLIGSEKRPGYGLAPPQGQSWRQHLISPLRSALDMKRVHFTGAIPHEQMLAALSISSAHVYFTYPFILSWSLLEAMSSSCFIVGSRTAPLYDAIEDGQSGVLLDFFDRPALEQTLINACLDPVRFEPMRAGAREVAVRKFDRVSVCLPAWLRLIHELL